MQVFIFVLVRWCAGTAVREEKHERYLFVIIFFSNFVGEKGEKVAVGGY